MSTDSTTQRWANLPAAAEYADRHPKTLRRWIDAGLLPAVRYGPRLIQVDLDDIDHLLRQPLQPTGGTR